MKSNENLQDQLSELQAKTAQERLKAVEADRDRLDARQARIMEYFWNRERQRQRRSLPLGVIFFFERDRQPPGGEEVIDQQTTTAMTILMAKDYIRANASNELELEVHGVNWILHEHPPVVRWWQKALQRVPPIWQLAATVVGLPASIYGVIQFVIWIANLFSSPVAA